ncbi:hypothetical protein BH09VER1_BH09VER1_24500 [soil metagenome]
MTSSESIQIGAGAPVTVDTIKFSSAVWNGNHQGQESLNLTFPRRLAEAGYAALGSKLVLRSAGVVRFVGWNEGEPRAASAAAQNITSIFAGAWRWLDRQYYTRGDNGLFTLGQPVSGDAEHAPLRQCLIDVLDFAVAGCGGAFTYAPLDEDLFNIEIPWKRRRDDLCGTILRSLFAYVPTAALRWSYDGTTPVLEIVDTATAGTSHSFNDSLKLTNIPTLHRRDDLLRDRVVINYTKNDLTVGTDIVASGGDAAALGVSFTQVYTFPLQDNEPVPAAGLASKLAAWHQAAHVETNIEKPGLDWTWRAGEKWGYSAGSKFAFWSAYTSICQSISRNILTKHQTAVVGVPAAPSTYRLSRNADNNGSSSSVPPGKVNINCTDEDDAALADGAATVGGQTISTGAFVKLAPGNYKIFFLPIVGRKTPAPISIEVVSGGELTETGKYYWQDEIYLENKDDPSLWSLLKVHGDTPSLTINKGGLQVLATTELITISKEDGSFVTINAAGFLQLQDGASGKQVYLDPKDINHGSYLGIKDDKTCNPDTGDLTDISVAKTDGDDA